MLIPHNDGNLQVQEERLQNLVPVQNRLLNVQENRDIPPPSYTSSVQQVPVEQQQQQQQAAVVLVQSVEETDKAVQKKLDAALSISFVIFKVLKKILLTIILLFDFL